MHSDAATVGDYLSELDDDRRQAISAVRRTSRSMSFKPTRTGGASSQSS